MKNRKLTDHLWTARWAVGKEKKKLAHDEITEALYEAGALKRPKAKAVKKPVKKKAKPPVSKESKDLPKGIRMPKIVEVKDVGFVKRGFYKTPSKNFEGLGTHYTVSGRTARSAKGVLKYLASIRLMCMVMDEDGTIYIPKGFDIFKHWGAHLGRSKWMGQTSLNSKYAGMEICCWGRNSKKGPIRKSKGEANIIAGSYQEFTKEQEEEYINFCLYAKWMNPNFNLDKLIGHDEARTAYGRHGDKQDPGASLSMTMPELRSVVKAKWAKIK